MRGIQEPGVARLGETLALISRRAWCMRQISRGQQPGRMAISAAIDTRVSWPPLTVTTGVRPRRPPGAPFRRPQALADAEPGAQVPVKVLNPVKAVPEAGPVFSATVNPVQILTAIIHHGRGIAGWSTDRRLPAWRPMLTRPAGTACCARSVTSCEFPRCAAGAQAGGGRPVSLARRPGASAGSLNGAWCAR